MTINCESSIASFLVVHFTHGLKGEFNVEHIMAKNEQLCLIKS